MEGFDGLVRELETSNQVEPFPKSCLFHRRIALHISQREVSVKCLVISLFSQLQSSQVFIFFRLVSEGNLDCSGVAILGTHYPHFNILSCILIEYLKRRLLHFSRRSWRKSIQDLSGRFFDCLRDDLNDEIKELVDLASERTVFSDF